MVIIMELRAYQSELLEQTRAAYRDGYHAPCIVSPCGSGKSVMMAEMARSATAKGNRVLFLVHRQELCQQIFSTFVRWGVDMQLCKIMMVQTATRRLEKLPKPNLIITDENHHSKAAGYRKIYDYWSEVPRVGVTATPIRLNGSGLGDVNDKLIIGPSVKDLIAWGNLSPFKYYAPAVVDTSKLQIKRGEFVQTDIDELFNAKAIYGDVIEHYNKLSAGKQAICYCATIAQSKKMAFEFSKADINARHLDGDTPKAVRARIIDEFRQGGIRILCNVDLISEGFDVPDCHTAILLRPTQSLALYIQQSMRCMRYQPGKTAVIIDHVGNVSRFGPPDMDRVWSLESPKKRKKTADEDGFGIKQCPSCFYVYDKKEPFCPNCGFKPVRSETEMAVIQDVQLVEVESKPMVLDYREPSDCHSLQELQDLAKNRGYKSGWAWHQARRLGIL